ncbi:MAG: DUF3473 domain-containing protein [Eubacteriales bacterium]
MKNALTVDVEDWYQTEDLRFEKKTWSSFEDRVDYSTRLLLDIFAESGLKATFFVLGLVAAAHPDLVRDIVKQGHELADHSYNHEMVTKQGKEEFREDIIRSKRTLEDISGVGINTFRAPSWSINGKNLWALEVLEEEGYKYDCSLQPFKTPLSGMSGIPVVPFHPIVNGRELKLVELPSSVVEIGKARVPFAGGLYSRFLFYYLIKKAYKNVNKSRSVVAYFHPWEQDGGQPKVKVTPLIKFTHYYNIENNIDKIKKIITDFDFAPVREILIGVDYPVVSI